MKTRTAITFACKSDIGLVRKENQDACGSFPEMASGNSEAQGGLFVIADGMGGYQGGREASSLAVEVVHDAYFAAREGSTASALLAAVQKANEAIYRRSVENPALARMGSTCTALAIRNGEACIAHIGDSRAYRVTRPEIRQLTEDHSQVAEMQRAGVLSRESARAHPERSVITRALGVTPEADIDVIEDIDLGGNQTFLLCTDGLYNNLEDAEIQDIIVSMPPEGACRSLVELANARGGQDNATAQVIRVQKQLTFAERLRRIF